MNSARRILLAKKKLNGDSLFFGLTKGEQAIAAVMDEIIEEMKRATNAVKDLIDEDCA